MTSEARSRNMAAIKSKNTKPEIEVRKMLHALGYRFRLHRKDLPGKPDIVLPKYKIAIFVNGCFWHQHENCKHARFPKTNRDFWKKKLEGNKLRDKLKQSQLKDLGWKIINVWECEIKNESDNLSLRLKEISN